MRFVEFKLYEAAGSKVFAIGDSLAVGIKDTNGIKGDAQGGISCSAVLAKIKSFTQSNDVSGSIVIVGTGAPNSPGEIDSVVPKQIALLKSKGATPVIIGAGPGGGTSKVNTAGINEKLASISSQAGVKFTGPLIDMFPDIMKMDPAMGLHLSPQAYKKLYQSIVNSTTPTQSNVGGKEDTTAAAPLTQISVPSGRVGPEVADIQKLLVALGYQLPKHGVDGIRGPETSAAVKQFQADSGIDVDGDPGPDTVGKLNAVLKSKPELSKTLTKSTAKEVKSTYAGAFDLNDEDVKKYRDLPTDALESDARKAADTYLGRAISDLEWNWLVRATYAESGRDIKSYAMVMGTMLNHTKRYAPNVKNGIIVALQRRNAFQAVTGTAPDFKPSAGFESGPPSNVLRAIYVGAIKYLDQVSPNQMNFSAMDPRAYGPGTNIGWRDQQLATKGSSVQAGSVFNTTLGQA